MKNKLVMLLILLLVATVSCSTQNKEVFDEDFTVEFEIDLSGQHYRWGSNWR